MATALIALDGDGSKIIGVWIARPDGVLDRAFRGSPYQLQNSQGIAEAKPAELSWACYCQQLAQRTPVSIWWESMSVQDGTTARAVLDAEVRKQFSQLPSSGRSDA